MGCSGRSPGRPGRRRDAAPTRVSRDADRHPDDENEPVYARQAMRAGVLGYVLKEAADAELVDAVRRAAAGDVYVNPRLGARVAAEPPPGPPDGLSERQAEVLRMVALGHTNAEIADTMYLSVRTVETHRANIHRKLGLDSRSALVRYALECGLIKP